MVNVSSHINADISEAKPCYHYNSLKDFRVYSALIKPKTNPGEFGIPPLIRDSKTSEVYVWGSNSSFQLGETGLERVMLPKLANSFTDVDFVRQSPSIRFSTIQPLIFLVIFGLGRSWTVLHVYNPV